TASVTNIGSDEEVRVRIRYLQQLAYDDGGFRIQFPMVVAPRYMPGDPAGKQGPGWSPDTIDVPDASRITPPVAPPGTRLGNNIRLRVNLDAGVPIHSIRSLQHQVDLNQTGPYNYQVTLSKKDEIPNRDFILDYKVADNRPRAAMIVSPPVNGSSYFMMMALPQAEVLPSDTRPKEMVFVIDTSGSMEGPKIIQARNALRTCLHGLNPQDSFNIIRFSSDFQVFSQNSVEFTQENVDQADQFIDTLRAGGGTEIIPPLLHAFNQPYDGKLRVVVFITDAEVGNDAAILKTITENLGDSRLFTFGIDTAPNDYLMKKMAEFGRGGFEFVTPNQDIAEVIGRFQNRISSPVITGIQVKWNGLSVTDTFPKRVPDLYAAQPVIIYGKLTGQPNGRVTLTGDSRQGTVSIPLDIETSSQSQDSSAIAAMWARSNVDEMTDDLTNHPGDVNLQERIAEMALNFRLMTPFTSFVAVEEVMESSPNGGPPRKVVVPVPLPDSWDYDKVFGGRTEYESKSVARSGFVVPSPTKKDSGRSVGGASRAQIDTNATAPPPPPGSSGQPVSGLPKGTLNSAYDGIIVADDKLKSIKEEAPSDRAKETAQFLVRKQSVAGFWSDSPSVTDLDSTSITLLAHIASGETDRAGYYQSQVQRGLNTLMSRINANGMLRTDHGDSIKSQALALWVFSEATAATNSSRYRSTAEKLSAGLAAESLNSNPNIDDAMWALMALSSSQRAGITVDKNTLTRLANTINSSQQASQVQQALAASLAGSKLSNDQRNQTLKEISAFQPRFSDQESVERGVMILFAARTLDLNVATSLEQRMVNALKASQSANGKEAGAFVLDDKHLVADSARVYLLLNVLNGHWAITK